MTEASSAQPRAGATRLTPAAGRHRRALRIMVVALIPLGIWTIAGLIAFWPSAVSSHVAQDVSGYTVPGTTYPTARITAIIETSCEGAAGSTPGRNTQTCANVTAELLEGLDQGQRVELPLTDAVYGSGTRVGQQIKLVRLPAVENQPASYQFSHFERSTPLIALTVLFALAVVVVARWRGFASLIGLAFAGFILVKFMFPALISGTNPLVVGLVGSSAIMFVVLYAAHGFSARTTTALLGTLFGLILTAALGYAATRWAHLTGVTAEDDYVLAAAAPDLRLTSVVICGIIVAGLGVLNDVTITQASAVWELADTDPSRKHLFSSAMRIGRDHIASTVYTIAFATAGAALPVLLLIAIYNRPLLQVVQTEQFAGEVIRALVGAIGLVLAVPLTTAIGVAVVRASRTRGHTPLPAQPAPSPEPAAPAAAQAQGARRPVVRRRRRQVEDLDFSDLREPADDDTQVPPTLMRAVVYDAVGQRPELREVPEPSCPASGVVVEVGATGVCRSDWHAWRGHDQVPLPHIGGHELAGRVVEVGPYVRRAAVGDRVTVPFVCGCGYCEHCQAGEAQVCAFQTQPGFTGPGSFAERVALHAADANLVPLPESLDFLTAASLGCRFATAYRALTAHGRLGSDAWLAVYGCGGVGLSAVMIGVALGARVVAVDVSPAALALALELGAEVSVDSRLVDPATAVGEATGGGAHVSMDALGSPATAAASVRSLRRRGRHLQVGLLLGRDASPPLPMDRVVSHELEIYGSHGMAAHEYPALLALIESGALHPERLIGAVIGLADVPEALTAMDGAPTTAGITVVKLTD